MFDDIQKSCDIRIVEIREYLDFFSSHSVAPPVAIPRGINTAKGTIFVLLYGLIEYTVLSTINRAVTQINSANVNVSDLRGPLLSLVFNANLDSLINVQKQKWERRYDLFVKIESNEIATIDSGVIPTDGNNITFKQLKTIWDTFQINLPIFKNVEFRGRLSDIVTNRVNIAHGNLSAADIGKTVTFSELTERVDDVLSFCSYFIDCFKEYIEKAKYMKDQLV